MPAPARLRVPEPATALSSEADPPSVVAAPVVRAAVVVAPAVVAPVVVAPAGAVPAVAVPAVAGPARFSMLARLRATAWGTGVLLASAVVGLLLAAAVWGLVSHHSATVPAFAGPTPGAPARFNPGSVLTEAKLPPGASITAQVHARVVAVYRHANARRRPRLVRTLYLGGRPLPLIMLVVQRRHGWLKVELPVRPNLSTGWIRSARVSLSTDLFHARVRLTAHELTVWRGRQVIGREPIGVGASVSPTPSGRYYITDLIRPPDPNGLYGRYAFGLSAYSPVYTSFAGGNGQIGLHGTNDPTSIGQNVSHGCIRLSNAGITKLAKLLPIGTPVQIQR